MALPAQRVPTFDELYQAIRALPEGITGEILMDGVIETMGRPGRSHSRFARRLGALLVGSLEDVEERSGWVIEPERELRLLVQRLVVPDHAGWRVGEDGTDFLNENPVTRRPEWVCEILSASTEKRDREQKLPLYSAAGVPHVWIVNPDERFVEVWTPRGKVRTVRAGAVVRLPPFDLEIDLSTLWVPSR